MSNDSQWDERLKSFLKKTQQDLKRAGNDMRVEAEKLLKEVKDPERQAKVKAGLKDFGTWARKTAEDVAGLVETGVKKAETTFREATSNKSDPSSEQPPPPAPTPRDAAPPAHQADSEEKPAPPAEKSIGPKKGKKKASGAAKPAKKTIGRASDDGDDEE